MTDQDPAAALPVEVALVVPARGLRRWQVAAIRRAEREGIVRVVAVFESGDTGNSVREGTLALLSAVESLASHAGGTPKDDSPPLRERCKASAEWPDAERPAASSNGWIQRGRRWPLILNLSAPHLSERMTDLATIGVLEFRIGRTHDIDDALECCRLGQDTIALNGVLVGRGGRLVVGHAVAGVRERTMIVTSLELLLARATTVLFRAIRAACGVTSVESPMPPQRAARPLPPFSARAAAELVTSAVGDYARTARERLRSGMPQWFLAYRERPEHFVSNALACSPDGLRVMMPPAGRFFADPCVFTHEGTDHVFFEDFDYRSGKGVISWMEHLAPGTFSPPEIVLDREYHLAYPFVFTAGADVYMVPETAQTDQIELYRAVSFPRQWERVAVLVQGVRAADATLLHEGGRWWMFATVSEGHSSACDELFVFYADALCGPWQPHAANPVKSDIRSARPAGRFFRHGDLLIRPAQNCSRRYGGSVSLCEVLELTPSTYRERVIQELHPGWVPGNARFHTVSASEHLEFLDGNFSRGCAS